MLQVNFLISMIAKQNETCKVVECQKGMQVFIPLSCKFNYFFNWLVYNFHKKTVCQYSRQCFSVSLTVIRSFRPNAAII